MSSARFTRGRDVRARDAVHLQRKREVLAPRVMCGNSA